MLPPDTTPPPPVGAAFIADDARGALRSGPLADALVAAAEVLGAKLACASCFGGDQDGRGDGCDGLGDIFTASGTEGALFLPAVPGSSPFCRPHDGTGFGACVGLLRI